MNREYITLWEFLDDHCPSSFVADFIKLEAGEVIKAGTINFYGSLMSNVFGFGVSEPAYKDEVNTLFCKYIVPKYKDYFVYYFDEGMTDAEKMEQGMKFVRSLHNNIITSYDEFKQLLDIYNNIKTHLMDDIKTQTKFNDTPQTVTTAGVTSYDDTYNSTVTTSYNEVATKIARFNEISDTIYDIYDRWAARVCKDLFIIL